MTVQVFVSQDSRSTWWLLRVVYWWQDTCSHHVVSKGRLYPYGNSIINGYNYLRNLLDVTTQKRYATLRSALPTLRVAMGNPPLIDGFLHTWSLMQIFLCFNNCMLARWSCWTISRVNDDLRWHNVYVSTILSLWCVTLPLPHAQYKSHSNFINDAWRRIYMRQTFGHYRFGAQPL